MNVRRVVIANNSEGKSVVSLDGPSPKSRALQHTPGFIATPLWFTTGPTQVAPVGQDRIASAETLLPGAGGSSFMVVTFPPDSVFMSPEFNPALSGAEFVEAVPGIAHAMEPENPGMHTTATVDYCIVLEGEAVLELDDGKVVHLKTHDTVIQNGGRHAWRNPSDKPVTMAFILIGATKA